MITGSHELEQRLVYKTLGIAATRMEDIVPELKEFGKVKGIQESDLTRFSVEDPLKLQVGYDLVVSNKFYAHAVQKLLKAIGGGEVKQNSLIEKDENGTKVSYQDILIEKNEGRVNVSFHVFRPPYTLENRL